MTILTSVSTMNWDSQKNAPLVGKSSGLAFILLGISDNSGFDFQEKKK